MTSKISKKFGQLKQWTGEKFGTEKKTEASVEFRNLSAEIEARKEGIERLHDALIIFLRTFGMHVILILEKKRLNILDSTKSQPSSLLGILMVQQGRLIGFDTTYGSALVKSGELLQQLSQHEVKFYGDVKRSFLAQLEQILTLIQEYQTMKKKLLNRRLDYDAKLNRLQKAKKEKPALQVEVDALRLKYEETLSNLEKIMNNIKSKELELSNGLYHFTEALFQYYQSSSQLMLTEKDSIFPDLSLIDEVPVAPEIASDSSLKMADNLSTSVSSLKLETQDKVFIRAKYNFMPEKSTAELGLTKGEILTLESKYPDGSSDGWWSGTNNRGESGIFPAAYVEVLTLSEYEDTSLEQQAQHSGNIMSKSQETCQAFKEEHNLEPVEHSNHALSSDENHRLLPPEDCSETNTTTSETIPKCYVCGCKEFARNIFKKDSCNNCFHKHYATAQT